MIQRLQPPSRSHETCEGRITPATLFLQDLTQYAIFKLPSSFEYETNLEKFDHFFSAQNRGRSRAWRLHPTSGLSVQDACDSKSQKASVLILWTFSEGDAPMSLALNESLRLRTRLSCGARFTEKTQRTLCGGFYG